MGADIVIAINLDSKLVSRKRHKNTEMIPNIKPLQVRNEFLKTLAARYEVAGKLIRKRLEKHPKKKVIPNTRQAINAAIQLMQERITRVNFAVNPPDILITPRLGDLKMLDYDQVEHAIEEGYIATQNKISDIKMLLETHEV